MNVVQLPIAESPIIGLHYLAYPLNILLNYEDCMPWFYSNYIQLVLSKDFSIPLTFYPNSFSTNPLLGCHVMVKEIIQNNNINIHNFIMERINNKDYFYSTFDEFYVPNRFFFNKDHFNHDFMIYGYDSHKMEYDLMGFDENRNYASSKISFLQFEKAFFSDSSKTGFIHLLSKRDNVKYDFDLRLVFEMLDDYYNSRNSSEKVRMNGCLLVNRVFGLEVYKYLKEYFKFLMCEDFDSDIRLLHILYEHKKCMLMRLEYMYKNNYINDNSYIYDGYKYIEQETFKTKTQHFKYIVGGKKRCLSQLVDSLSEIEQKESELIERLMNEIYHKL